MKYAELNALHPLYDAESWADNVALYRGGKAFHARIGNFLFKNSIEDPEQYQQRCKEATYRPYIGSICKYFTAFLFSASFDIRRKDRESGQPLPADSNDFYSKWKEEVARNCDLVEFLHERMTQTMQKAAAHWIVEFPNLVTTQPRNMAEFHEQDAGRVTLRRVDREDVFDWESDDAGNLIWVNIHEKRCPRPNPTMGRDLVIETWRIYDATRVTTYQVQYKKTQRPQPEQEILMLSQEPHGSKQVPLVTLNLQDGLCPVEEAKDGVLDEFRLRNAINWNIKQTCYAMPVFNVENQAHMPVMGPGYGLVLGPVGKEDMNWRAPPTEHLALAAKEKDSAREELYRITHQLALAVENNSAAIGRSGESKQSDAAATKVVLNAFGGALKKAMEETFEIISNGRGDVNTVFSVEGLDTFDTDEVTVLLEQVAEVQTLQIPSKTLRKETSKRAALSLVKDAEQSVKDQICEEIDEGVDAQGEMERMQIEQPELNANKVPVLSGGKAKPKPPEPKPFQGPKGTVKKAGPPGKGVR